jgi:hypothetical protein
LDIWFPEKRSHRISPALLARRSILPRQIADFLQNAWNRLLAHVPGRRYRNQNCEVRIGVMWPEAMQLLKWALPMTDFCSNVIAGMASLW